MHFPRLLFILSFFSVPAHATFIADPQVVDCGPAGMVSDAGYFLKIGEFGGGGFMGSFSRMTNRGLRGLGDEPLNIATVREEGVCKLKITQVNDRDGNELDLKIGPIGTNGRHLGRMFMKMDGHPIPEPFRNVSCSVAPNLYSRYCPTTHGGTIYQEAPAPNSVINPGF